jgi:tetratricopeptide (TPR) repeat protein
MTFGPDLDRRWWLFAIAACSVAEVFLSTAARSQSQNWDWCTGKNRPTLEQRIAACTAIIETGTEPTTGQAKAFSNRGVATANSGNFASAVQDYEESLRLDSTSPSSHRVRGNIYRISKNYEGALAEYNEAIRLDPADLLAFTNRGLVFLDTKDYDRAIADFNEALRLDPKFTNAFYGRATAYRARGELSQAIADYDQTIELDPTLFGAVANRGRAHHLLKDYDRAIVDYSEAIRLNPKFASAFNDRGQAYRAKGDNALAISDYDQAIQLDPKSTSAIFNRGNTYYTQKAYDRAIADYSEAIRLDPTLSVALYYRGSARYYIKDYDGAIVDYSEAIRINPKYAAAFIDRGQAYRQKGDTAQAISNYDQAIQIDPKSTSAFLNRGNAHYAQKDYDRAIADYSEVIHLDEKYATAFLYRGRAYAEKDDITQALANYDQAIQINPTLDSAYAFRCGARIRVGRDLQSALSDCNESLRLQPGQTTALTHRGFVHLRLGSITQAIVDFDAALSNDATYAWSLYGRGLAKWKQGNESGAETDATAAIKIRPDIGGSVYKYYGAAPEREFAARRATAFAQANPMIFVIAKGNDACGVGCSEWIAADGAFDQGAEKRFRNFLSTLKGRNPPIFFNSTGGSMSQSYAVGRILRERKMTASVGTTIPEECHTSTAMDASCRQLVQSNPSVKAELRTAGAICHSACVYAIIGASIRQIPAGARLGVHATVRSSPAGQSRRSKEQIDEQNHAARLRYTQQMGVDPELVELADKTPNITLRILSQDEIARFRVETPRH